MQKHKTIVKELKRPDHFVDFWTHTWQRLLALLVPRQKPALAASVAIAVVLIGAAIFNHWDGSRRLTASRELVRIQQMQTAELLPAVDETKNDIGDDAKADVPRFKTQAERQAAVLKELDGFLSQHGSSGLMAEAQIMRGAVLMGLGRFDDAIAAYQNALSSRLDARLRFLAHEGQGYAYEGKGDLDKALSAFGQIAGDASEFRGFYEDGALYHKARLTELKGDKSGAVKIYKQILDKVPDTAMKDQITDRLALLEAK